MSTVRTTEAFRLELAAKHSGDKLLDLADQRSRLEELQSVLSHAQILMEAVCYDRITEREAMSATYFAGMVLESMAHGMAEDAVLFSMLQLSDAEKAKKGNVK